MLSKVFKILGRLDDEDGAGVVGHNTATSGDAIGVEGTTESDEGYGLYTGDDARVDGQMTTTALGTEAVNNVATPRPEDGGAGINDALNEDGTDVVMLQYGTYETTEVIDVTNDKAIVGAGPRGQTTIKAVCGFPSNRPVIEGASDSFGADTIKPHLSDFSIDANGFAQDCLEIGEGGTDFTVRRIKMSGAYRDGLRLIGSFNGTVQDCEISWCNRAGIVIGDNKAINTDAFRPSALTLLQNHVLNMGGVELDRGCKDPIDADRVAWSDSVGILVGSGKYNYFEDADYEESTTGAPNIQYILNDLKDVDIGLYLGQYASEQLVSRFDAESCTEAGLKIGSPTLAASDTTKERGDYLRGRPRDITVVGGTYSAQDVATTAPYDVVSGSNIILDNITQSPDDEAVSTGLRIAAETDVPGPTHVRNARLDSGYSGVSNDANVISHQSELGTAARVTAPRLEVAAGDLTAVPSQGINDYRHHDGSNGHAAGLYRGDGDGGWVRVEDNAVTI